MTQNNQVPQPVRTCPTCGAEVPGESKFCLKCGKELAEVSPQSKTPRKFKWTSLIPYLVSAAVIIFVAVGGKLFLKEGNDGQMAAGSFLAITGFVLLSAGVVGIVVNLIRKRSKKVWANIAYHSFCAMVVGFIIAVQVTAVTPDDSTTNNPSPTGQTSPTAKPTSATPTLTPTAGGSIIPVAQQTIPASGGTITVNKPGEALNGLQVTVPSGAYKTSTNFTITSQAVKSSNPDYTVASPLITINNGGVLADQPISVKIPVKVADNEFVMGFYYDVTTGEMEGIPTTQVTSDSFTLATRHFSTVIGIKVDAETLHKREMELIKQGPMTEFAPGQDDWQFENDGTFLTPDGNCAGMAISELWYYEEVSSKGKGDSLNSLYAGKAQEIHEDDALAWKLVSTIQKDFETTPSLRAVVDLRPAHIDNVDYTNQQTFDTFAFSMMITNRPQIVGMVGKEKTTGNSASHAMVAYGISADGILVADPNDPGAEHSILFKNGKLSYETDDVNYDLFVYEGKGAMISWDKVAARWAEMSKQTIGEQFPKSTFTVTDDKGKQYALTDTLSLDGGKTIFIEISSSAPLGVSLYRDRNWVNVDSNGWPVPSKKITLDLKKDANLLGLYVLGNVVNGTPPWQWADFKWVTINYQPAATPTPKLTPVSLPETWMGKIGGTGIYQGPGSVSYMWQEIDYSFNFDVSFTAMMPKTTYDSIQGTASITGSADVTNAVKSQYAVKDKRVGSVTGGILTGGSNVQATVSSDSISLRTPDGGPYLVFGQYSHNTWEGNGSLFSQSIYLTIEKRTATEISGHWRFDSLHSTKLPQGTGTILPIESDGYTFTLTKQP